MPECQKVSFIFKFLVICISKKYVGNRSEKLHVRASLVFHFFLLPTKQPGEMLIVARRIPWPVVCP